MSRKASIVKVRWALRDKATGHRVWTTGRPGKAWVGLAPPKDHPNAWHAYTTEETADARERYKARFEEWLGR